MKLSHLATASAAVALLGGAAYAQQPQPPAAPTPGSVTGDWNGPHAPTDDKQYQEKTPAPAATPAASEATSPPTASTDVTAPAAEAAPGAPAAAAAPAATGVATGAASFTNLTITNGPIPDTQENRRKYGRPMSNAGKRSAAAGN